MDRPPRSVSTHLLDLTTTAWSAGLGLVGLASVLLVVAVARQQGASLGGQRTLAFVALLASNVAMLLTCRRTHEPFWKAFGGRNVAVTVVIAGALAVTLLAILVPPVRDFLGFEPCAAASLAGAAVGAISAVLAVDALKALRPRPAA